MDFCGGMLGDDGVEFCGVDIAGGGIADGEEERVCGVGGEEVGDGCEAEGAVRAGDQDCTCHG